MSRLIENLESRRLMHSAFSASVNFQPLNAPRAPGLLTDYGAVYGVRRGGVAYGWSADNQGNAVDRNLTKVQKNDTFIAMQSTPEFDAGNVTLYNWEIGVENGNYDVYVVAGDPGAVNDRMAITVENELAVSGITRKDRRYLEGGVRVTVSDGKLTLGSAPWAVDNKVCYVAVVSTEEPAGGTLTITTPRPTAVEGGSFGQFTVTRTGDLTQPAVVPITMTGTATNTVDYGRFGPRLTFAAGQSTIDLKVRAIADGVSEGDEEAVLTISPAAGYQLLNVSAGVTVRNASVTPPPSTGPTTVTWATKAARPVAVSEPMSVGIGNKLYSFGGFVDSTFKPTRAAYAYDVPSNTWSRLADLPSFGLTHAGATHDSRYVYMAGGYPGNGSNGNQTFSTTNVVRYDTQTNTYDTLPALPSPRGAGSLGLLDGMLYFVAGNNAAREDIATVWALDLSDTSAGWVTRASLPAGRSHATTIGLNGKLYVIAGQTGNDDVLVTHREVYVYTPSTDSWTTGTPLPGTGRSHISGASFVYNNRIVVLAGEQSHNAALSGALEYDPATNTWDTLASLPAARFSGAGGYVGGKFVYSSGYNGGFKNNTYVGTLT